MELESTSHSFSMLAGTYYLRTGWYTSTYCILQSGGGAYSLK